MSANMVTVSDAEKNALVIEIEENLLASMQQKPKFIQEEFLHTFMDRDTAWCEEAIQHAILHGIDPQNQITQKFSTVEKTSRDDAWAAKSEERRLDDFQYEYFLSSLESTELQHLIYGEDWGSGSDVSFSLSERLAILKLPKEIFADTLEVLSTTNIEAYEAMMQQPLVSGQSGIRKKFSRKEKRERRERREKDSKDKEHLHSNKRRKKKSSSRHGQNDSPVHLESSATGKPDGLESNETWQEAKVFTESLAVVVAKAINEGTCGALLSALVLLQRIRRQRQLNPVSNGESHLLLPIANILAAYVEMQIDDRSGSESSKQFHNPFRHSLLSSKSMRLKSFSNSETSHNDGNSCYLDAMEVQSQDTASQSQDGGVCGPYSDAGSTIGSTVGSTFADVGTDGASNPGDIEASEDDLLAQALQMSAHDLMNLPPSASKSSLLNDGSKGLSDEASRSQNNNRNASLGSASSEAANDDRFPMESCAEEDIPIKQMPENLLPVLPMESLGPFYTSKFWKKVLEDTDTHNNSESSSSEVDGIDMGVSLDNTIVALLATLGICADKKMNISSGALYRTEDEESAKSTSNVSVAVAVTPLVPIVANKHVLALAEQLLSDLLVDIQLHLLKQDQFSRTSVCSDPLEGPYQSERADEIPEQDQQFDSLGDSSNSSFTDVFSDWQYNLYLQVWSANILLKVIQATVEEASEIKISVNSMGLALKDVMNDKWSTTSLGDRLKGTVSKFVGVFSGELNSFGNKGENNRILESGKSVDPNTKLDLLAFYPKRSAPLAVVMTNSAGSSQSNHFELPFAYSWTSLYHIVRCRAIDAYSMTFPFVLPSPIGRMHLLEQLLIQSADALEGRMTWVRDDNPSINRHFQWITEYCTSKELSPTGNVVYRLKNLPPSYYKLATVKRMIMVFAKNDACLQGFFSVITADGKRQLKRPRFDNLCRIDYEDDKLVVGDSNSETFTDRLARYSALETLLFPRIQQSVPSCDVSNRSSLQWGEFALLRSLQNFHIALHSKASLEWSANTYPVMRSLVFDANKCHPNLLLSEDCRVVRHCGPKLWASVVCDLRLSPQSGVYEVVVRIDKCAKGHVFLGVVTADMNTEKDSYVGVDRCGWGMIGTRSLWHNKTKVVVEYGAAFSTGSVIIISIDTDNAKISYRNLENDWGVAFENVASSNLFPAFSLHEKDDQVSLLTCRKVGCPRMASFLPVLKESQDSLVLYGRKLMATVLSLLDNLAQTQPSELRDSKIFLDHPLLGTFLPAFAAYFLSCRYCPVMIDALNFRLLPLFTRVCKQLVSIGESIESSLTDDVAHHRSSSAIGTYQPFGEWLIRSSAISGLNLPAQEYKLSLTSIDSEDDFDPAEGNKLCSTELGSLKTSGEGLGLVSGFLGKGVGTSTSVSLNGSQMGTRIRFLETWNMSNHSKIDARYSLCGKFFWGKFRDCKSGKLGCLDGSRTTEMNEGRDFVVRSVIQNCVGLCSSVVGKFAGLLLLADPSSVSIPSGGNDFDEQTERIDDWLDSELFSGGLNQNEHLNNYLHSQIINFVLPQDVSILNHALSEDGGFIFHAKGASTPTTSDVDLKSAETTYWWISTCIPSATKTAQVNLEADRVDRSSITETIEFSELDKYITSHVSGGVLTRKLGGEAVQQSRKLILNELVRHTGVLPLIDFEYRLLRETKTTTDRPHPILLDIWRAGQRVIDDLIRQKQGGDKSYEELCLALNTTISLLRDLQPCKRARENFENMQLLVMEETPIEQTVPITNSSVWEDIRGNIAKLISQVLEFSTSPPRSVDNLRAWLLHRSFQSVVRCAGFQALKLLANKSDLSCLQPELHLQKVGKLPYLFKFTNSKYLPGLSSLSLQSACFRYIPAAFRELGLISTKKLDSALFNNLSPFTSGHYLDGLHGANQQLLVYLKRAFESFYSSAINLLNRCTLASDRDSQLVLLAIWGININPEDHLFLSQISLFKIMQLVLDDVRQSISQLYRDNPALYLLEKQPGSEFGESELISRFKGHPLGLFWCDMTIHTRKKLAHLVLITVHSLASQVAVVSGEQPSFSLQSTRILSRTVSGPDTLSKSLFDLMYVEFFRAMRRIILKGNTTVDSGGDSGLGNLIPLKNSSDIDASTGKSRSSHSYKSVIDSVSLEEMLEGDSYIYQILRLLHLVSASSTCQQLLCRPKWISILLCSIGYGSIAIQRRICRLLRKLLMVVDPTTLVAYVPNFFSERSNIFSQDMVLLDDDFEEMISEYSNHSDPCETAKRICSFMFDVYSIVVPIFDDNSVQSLSFQKKLYAEGKIDVLSADALVVLRVLQGYSKWRYIIDSVTRKELSLLCTSNTPTEILRSVISSIGFYGGHFERLRIGGLVSLRPYCLLGDNDNYASRIAAASHTCGMLLSVSNTAAEVVLMERGVKILGRNVFLDTEIEKDLTVVHTTNIAGPFPFRVVRINAVDIAPCVDVPALPQFIGTEAFECITSYLATHLPEILTQNLTTTEIEEESDETISNTNLIPKVILESVLKISAMKTFCNSMQSITHVNAFLQDRTKLSLEKVLAVAMSTSSNKLDKLEKFEEKFSRMWSQYCSKFLKDEDPTVPTANEIVENQSISIPPNLGSVRETSSPLRDLAAILSPLGASIGAPAIDPNVQAVALSQMLEIGLPQDWCEFALRRCHYNVEMAINMCLEHGADIPQMIAEEAAVQASGASRDSTGRRNLRELFGGPRIVRGSRANPSAGSDSQALVRQLLEMGFPPSWCARALASGNNDLEAALFLLTQEEDMIASGDSERVEAKEDTSDPASPPLFNPLELVSGKCNIADNLTCSTTAGGFPSVGCRSYPAYTGKWYYELDLLTAGCIQVGWANTAYEGGADNGHGVGDDVHSWAYDGWRRYLWNEHSVDWGAKWAPGNTVGCAIDLDSQTMHFYLNGYGEEIGMGLAFKDYSSAIGAVKGGMYPCVSFNRNERVQYNFGESGFKYPPPLGYAPFQTHIDAVLKALEDRNGTPPISLLEEMSLSPGQKNCKFLSNTRRYFKSEDARAIVSAEDLSYFSGTAAVPKIPTDHRELEKEFIAVTAELVALYSNLAVLRCMNRVLTIDSTGFDCVYGRLTRVLDNDSSMILESSNSADVFSMLFDVIKQNSALTGRTRVYLSMVNTLPPIVSIPANQGSLFSAGGYPVLHNLQGSLYKLILRGVSEDSSNLVDQLVNLVSSETSCAYSRISSGGWHLDDGLVPFFTSETKATTKEDRLPYLNFAWWITSVLMKVFTEGLAPAKNELMKHWVARLLCSWSFVLHSPYPQAKHCAMKAVTYIVQHWQSLMSDFIDENNKIFSKDFLIRLEHFTTHLLCKEAPSYPLLSEFLQATLEFLVTVNSLRETELSFASKVSVPVSAECDSINTGSASLLDIPQLENKSDYDDDAFQWEAVSGMCFKEEGGWDVWSGHLQVAAVSALHDLGKLHDVRSVKTHGYYQHTVEKSEYPPELLPGCRVAKKIDDTSVDETQDSQSARSPQSSESARESLSRIQRIFEKTFDPMGKTPDADTINSVQSSEIDSKMILGTVTAIDSWDDRPGTARIVRWDLEEQTEKVEWNIHVGRYGVIHVEEKNGRISKKYPPPTSELRRLLSNSKFGRSDITFGLIFRLRSTGKQVGNNCTVVGVVEWPDFQAVVILSGNYDCLSGTYTLTEDRLLSGDAESGWEDRFGSPSWRRGTKYTLTLCNNSEAGNGDSLNGEYSTDISIDNLKLSASSNGTINLQKQHLFYFDSRYHANSIAVSNDKCTISKGSGDGQAVAFGSIGFSSGVHYWEFKIEQADMGSIFLGVAEKPKDNERLTRWCGWGFVSNRSTFRTNQNALGDRIQVYGDHFHTGDVVGVILDMNRGRISFVLDGMKYGEHSINDLGEAFNGLSTSGSVKPRTLYPVVGLSKNMDRVTLTRHWLSSIGWHPRISYQLYSRTWNLLQSWTTSRVDTRPLDEHLWVYRSGWRNWCDWKKDKFRYINSRCSSGRSIPIIIDISPRACVIASINTGLKTALFSGDRIKFSKSCGRNLDSAEEAVVLGTYRGQIWYRMDTQHSVGLSESGTSSWYLLPYETEGLEIVKRNPLIPDLVANIPLARTPMYHGGPILIFHDNGAVVRDGLEIDHAQVVCSIPKDTILYALEQRLNSSNINRYKVMYAGNCGWISEKIRGGSEEVMLRRLSLEDSAIIALRQDAIGQSQSMGMEIEFERADADTALVALNLWERHVTDLGHAILLQQGGLLSQVPICTEYSDILTDTEATFDDYCAIASSVDGSIPWSIDDDVAMVEFITKCASTTGTSPQNLSLSDFARCFSKWQHPIGSVLHKLSLGRAIARAALLKETNKLMAYALPMYALELPEEKLQADIGYCDELGDINIRLSTLQSKPQSSTAFSDSVKAKIEAVDREYRTSEAALITSLTDEVCKFVPTDSYWKPPCAARRIRQLRGLLFEQTKKMFWEAIVENTNTLTPLPQDEYEDPREIRNVKVNRIKANPSQLVTVPSASDRLKLSVFGQLHKEMRSWPSTSFRRSYIAKGHGGQKRFFKVKFVGEGVNDYGGPYRALFEQVVDEMQCDGVEVAGKKVSEKCVLPVLVPCPNRVVAIGSNQDKFLLTTSPQITPINQELVQFFGKLVGTAVRHNMTLALDFSTMVWRPLIKSPVSRADLQSVDTLTVGNLSEIEKVGVRLESEGKEDNYQPDEWTDLTFSTYLPDGTRIGLIPNGSEMPLTVGNWRMYVKLVEKLRLKESLSTFKVFKEGLGTSLPIDLFCLFSVEELERLISGTAHVNLDVLKQSTEYGSLSPDDAVVKMFWEVLEEMSDEERTLFLRFVWARSRLPATVQELPMNFKLQLGYEGSSPAETDQYLPHAQTCFFSLSLPRYSSKEILREKLLYAIHNSPNMDADVRLHNAEGWSEAN